MMSYTCDGCQIPLRRHVHEDRQDRETCPGCRVGHDGRVVGRLDPAHYCPRCAEVWDAHDAAVRTQRQSIVQTFETWLRTAEQALPLQRLPDA